jgi:hypothetical protein
MDPLTIAVLVLVALVLVGAAFEIIHRKKAIAQDLDDAEPAARGCLSCGVLGCSVPFGVVVIGVSVVYFAFASR